MELFQNFRKIIQEMGAEINRNLENHHTRHVMLNEIHLI